MVTTELTLTALVYNIKRVINILGVKNLLDASASAMAFFVPAKIRRQFV